MSAAIVETYLVGSDGVRTVHSSDSNELYAAGVGSWVLDELTSMNDGRRFQSIRDAISAAAAETRLAVSDGP